MEPTLPASGPSVEVGMQRPEVSRAPEKPIVQNSPETPAPVESLEQLPAAPASPQPVKPLLPMPMQVPQVSVTHTAQGAVPIDDNPAVANDDDVIEREWVQKAKKIVTQTKEDPYTQEKEVSKLQADYIKKRYGKEIKVTTD